MTETTSSVELTPEVIRRNIRVSAINHFFVEGAMQISEPSTVLPLYVKALGGSNFLAGLLPSLRWFGWLAPQFFAAGQLQHLRRFVPVTQLLEASRCVLYLALAGFAVAYGPQNPQLALTIFFILFMITRFSAGSSAVARSELMARIVPPKERSIIVSVRRLAGGIAGFASGFAVRYILDERVSSFPYNYAILLGVSGILFGIALLILSGIVEPHLSIKSKGRSPIQQIRRAPALLKRDRRFLSYIGVRAASSGLALAAPFYIIYATEVLGAPAAMAGIYISATTLARVLSNIFWGRQCGVRGSLWVLRVACALGVIAPLLVFPLSWATPKAANMMPMLFSLVFLVHGVALSADGIGRLAYLYDIAPDQDRPTYYGLSNTILGPLYFLPALGGALLDIVGFLPIFAAAAGLMALAFILATRLAVRDKTYGAYTAHIPMTD